MTYSLGRTENFVPNKFNYSEIDWKLLRKKLDDNWHIVNNLINNHVIKRTKLKLNYEVHKATDEPTIVWTQIDPNKNIKGRINTFKRIETEIIDSTTKSKSNLINPKMMK